MEKYYIQVEAVNLVHVVADTHDISTIRGGSFLLLDVIERLTDRFTTRLEKITTAASQGLFVLKEGGDRGRIEADILSFLRERTGGHATFLVAIEPDIPDNFALVLERLQAQIRRKQWRMPTVAVPEHADAEEECYLDGWRPGTAYYSVDGEESGAKISAATKFRRERGVRLKHQLMERILRDRTYGDDLNARDLGELATHPGMGGLNGKIAYIHVDGNSFGRIRRALCTTPEARRAFDKQIQAGCREPFLRELLARIDGDSDFVTVDRHGKQARRLEVLLWGGDEMTLIVPAWRGWQTLALFYQHARNLTFQGVELSHRAAIIFSHHNTPILQIRRIADELLALARGNIKTRVTEAVQREAARDGIDAKDKQQVLEWLASHRHGNAVHYLALESFDMLRGSLMGMLKVYYKNPVFEKMLLYADALEETLDDLKLIQASVPRGKVLRVIDALQKEYLFSFTPNPTDQVTERLDEGKLPVALNNQLQARKYITLAASAVITTDPIRRRWTVRAEGTGYVICEQQRTLHVYRQRDDEQLAPLGKEVLASVAPTKMAQVRGALDRMLAAEADHWYWIADLWDYVPEWKA